MNNTYKERIVSDINLIPEAINRNDAMFNITNDMHVLSHYDLLNNNDIKELLKILDIVCITNKKYNSEI